MDSFVDKLAQRFNAGEIIKANGEAEALEADRLKAQADEYDRMIQEVRRLNLKTAEISEQVSQLIRCGIEQIESYETVIRKEPANETVSEEIKDALKEFSALNLRDQQEFMKTQEDALKEFVTLNLRDQQEFMKIQQDILKKFTVSNLQDQQEFLKIRQDTMNEFTAENLRHQKELLKNQQDSINAFAEAGLQGRQDFMRDYQDSIRNLEDGITAIHAAVEGSLAGMEAYLRVGLKDYEPMLAAIHNDSVMIKSGLDENLNQLKDMVMQVRLLMDEQGKQVFQTVHTENIKVYRNVQAVVDKHGRELSDRLEVLEKKTNRPGILPVVTFLFAAASVVLQVLRILGIL